MPQKLDFDPNAPTKTKKSGTYDWATFVPSRTTKPKFSIHARRGDALNAVLAALDMDGDVILYRWEDGRPEVAGDIKKQGRWVEHCRFEDFRNPDDCEHCGTSMLRSYAGARTPGRGIMYNSGNRTWIDTNTHPRMIVVCNECRMFKSRTGRLP